MKTNKKTPILGLKSIISSLFFVELPTFDFGKYHPNLSDALKELYEIDSFFATHNCGYETIRFFSNIDRLVHYEALNLNENEFVFIHENQHNWACKTGLNSANVYYEDKVEPENSRLLKPTIDAFLITFALQEMAFNLKYYIGLEHENMTKIETNFNKIEAIWVEESYIYSHLSSFYLVDNDCFLMFAGMNILATNNEAKFNHYKSILKYYHFS